MIINLLKRFSALSVNLLLILTIYHIFVILEDAVSRSNSILEAYNADFARYNGNNLITSLSDRYSKFIRTMTGLEIFIVFFYYATINLAYAFLNKENFSYAVFRLKTVNLSTGGTVSKLRLFALKAIPNFLLVFCILYTASAYTKSNMPVYIAIIIYMALYIPIIYQEVPLSLANRLTKTCVITVVDNADKAQVYKWVGFARAISAMFNIAFMTMMHAVITIFTITSTSPINSVYYYNFEGKALFELGLYFSIFLNMLLPWVLYWLFNTHSIVYYGRTIVDRVLGIDYVYQDGTKLDARKRLFTFTVSLVIALVICLSVGFLFDLSKEFSTDFAYLITLLYIAIFIFYPLITKGNTLINSLFKIKLSVGHN